MRPYLSANEVAKLLRVDRATVTRWIKKGLLEGAHRPSGTRTWRVPLAACEPLVRQHHEGR